MALTAYEMHPKMVMGFDAVLADRTRACGRGPPRGRVGPSSRLTPGAGSICRPRCDETDELILRGADGVAEGVPEAAFAGMTLPKFRPDGGLADHPRGRRTPGLFSAIIGGWAAGANGSDAHHRSQSRADNQGASRHEQTTTSGRSDGRARPHRRPGGTRSLAGGVEGRLHRGQDHRPARHQRSHAAMCSSTRIQSLLESERGATVIRYSKPTFTKPAPVDLRHEIATPAARR